MSHSQTTESTRIVDSCRHCRFSDRGMTRWGTVLVRIHVQPWEFRCFQSVWILYMENSLLNICHEISIVPVRSSVPSFYASVRLFKQAVVGTSVLETFLAVFTRFSKLLKFSLIVILVVVLRTLGFELARWPSVLSHKKEKMKRSKCGFVPRCICAYGSLFVMPWKQRVYFAAIKTRYGGELWSFFFAEQKASPTWKESRGVWRWWVFIWIAYVHVKLCMGKGPK